MSADRLQLLDQDLWTASEPSLIVVSGLPGSGKTTLARAIGAQLAVPVVERDRLAEVCFDALSAGSPAITELGSVSYELLFYLARSSWRPGIPCWWRATSAELGTRHN